MGKGKLILICQSGGTFITNDDGSLSYTGGEAEAIDINHETVFDDLKFKLAEIWDLDYTSLSIKYFLPGNRRTLINLSNDRDLKRMYDFHGESVTADVFVTGRKGFDQVAFDMHHNRACGIKVAETVIATVASQPAMTMPVAMETETGTIDDTSKLAPVASRDNLVAAKKTTKSSTRLTAKSKRLTTKSSTRVTRTSKRSRAYKIDSDPGAACSVRNATADDCGHGLIIVDMSATPADTVKKRRRTAYWQSTPNGPTIVSITENVGETRKGTSRRRNVESDSPSAISYYVEQQVETGPLMEDSSGALVLANTGDASSKELIASWKDCITGVGHEFQSVVEFRDALQKYAIAHRFMYRLKKNDTNRASGRCIADGCSWRIHASWVKSAGVFRVKKMNESHTCGGESWKAAHPTKHWLVSIIKERLQDSPHHRPKDIAKEILRDFGITLNYTQVWRGIEDAREQLQGSYKDAYARLPWFCDRILEANPESYVKLSIDDSRKFQRLFVSFHASIHGFKNGCRPLIFLDATAVKSKYHEILLTASALDGDDGVFPVAVTLVDIDNVGNWQWFLEQLRSALSTSRSITFVSDREKGLTKCVLEVFENAHHGYSMFYLMENFMRDLKGPFHGDGRGSLPVNFLAAARAVRVDAFKMFTERIKRISPRAYDWVMTVEPEHWADSAFKGERYSQITFNIAELYAKWTQEVWQLPIIQKIEKLISKMMELINDRRNISSDWSSKLTPSKEEKVEEERRRACDLKVLFSSDTLFEVHDTSINVVDIDKRDCSCLAWKVTGLPCRHAIAVFSCTGRSVYDYCSNYFTVDNFHVTYSKSINLFLSVFNPSDEEKAGSEAETVLPPSISRPPSQEKKKPNKSKGRIKRLVFCTRCKGAGHNKATCKEIEQGIIRLT